MKKHKGKRQPVSARKTRRFSLRKNRRGEGYVDTGVKILIAVVIGALLLGGIYALFRTTILPSVNDKVEDLFEYNGAPAPAPGYHSGGGGPGESPSPDYKD